MEWDTGIDYMQMTFQGVQIWYFAPEQKSFLYMGASGISTDASIIGCQKVGYNFGPQNFAPTHFVIRKYECN